MTELEKVSAVMGAQDADDLRWYFANGGLNQFAGSPLGAMLEKMELFSAAARPCVDCGGDLSSWTGGYGFLPDATPIDGLTDAQRDQLQLLNITLKSEGLAPVGDCTCKRCKGTGWVIPKHRTHAHGPLTARPTGSSKKGGNGGGIDVSEVNMATLGRVTRKLTMVRGAEGNIPAGAALEAFYSPDSSDDPGCLWHLVPVGKTMLRGNSQKLHPNQFFQNLRLEQEANPSANRKMQFEEAQTQATELYRASCQIWNGV